MNELKSISMENNKEEKYSITKEIKKDGITKRLTVDQVENGFIICINKYGNKKNDEGKNEYFDITKKYISETNPLEKEKKEETEISNEVSSNSVIDAINNLNI